jgi:hypothetical protein
MLFHTGRILATPGALGLAEAGVDLLIYPKRHLCGDWGDLDEHDKAENDFSAANGYRILSAYNTPKGRLWIITEADRRQPRSFSPVSINTHQPILCPSAITNRQGGFLFSEKEFGYEQFT